jgi:hypothetical protein
LFRVLGNWARLRHGILLSQVMNSRTSRAEIVGDRLAGILIFFRD